MTKYKMETDDLKKMRYLIVFTALILMNIVGGFLGGLIAIVGGSLALYTQILYRRQKKAEINNNK